MILKFQSISNPSNKVNHETLNDLSRPKVQGLVQSDEQMALKPKNL